MKTITVGLIPITTSKTLRAALMCAFTCAIMLGVSTPAAFAAGPDEWPEVFYFNADDAQPIAGEAIELSAVSGLACRPSIQISLNHLGFAVVSPEMMLHVLDFPPDQYNVITDTGTDTVTCANLGQTLMATVQEIPTGNTCMSIFTVEDKLGPTFVCEDDTIPCNVNIPELDFLSFIDTLFDNCTPFDDLEIIYSYTVTELDCDPDSIAAFIDVAYTATDNFGNTSSCEQTIRLKKFSLDDVVFPADTMLSCINPDVSPENVGQPTIGGTPIDHFCELVSWSTETQFPLCSGEFKVTRLWSVMDWCTGETRNMMQSIHVKDTFPPEIDCPEDITIGTDPTVCFATYTFPNPDVTDVCSDDDLIETKFRVSGFFLDYFTGDQIELPPGDHIVTVMATDDCLTTGTCQYTITVVDDEAPVLVCNNYSTNLNDFGFSVLNATSAQFFADDNCGIDSIAVRKMVDICGNPQDTVYGPFVTFCCAEAGTSVMVLFQAIDVNGNVQECMIEVQVKDATPPVAQCRDIMVFLDINGVAGITAEDIDSMSFDNCDSITLEIDKDSFECADLHASLNPHDVTLTVTDLSGNVSTCIGQVTVKDTIRPEAICQDITIMLDTMGFASIVPSDVDGGSVDNCQIVEYRIEPDSFSCADVGTPVDVELLVIDQSGNRDSCIAEVTVLDNPPTVECKDATLFLDSTGLVVVQQMDIDDAMDDCGPLTVEITPDSLFCDDVGTLVVTLRVIDIFNNSASCTSLVTVIDSIAPACEVKDTVVFLDENGFASLDSNALDDGSMDECGLLSITLDPSTFGCADVNAPVIVTQTVTDNNGNTSSCTASVTVIDTIPPDCIAVDTTVFLDGDGLAMIDSNGVDGGSGAACGLASIEVDRQEFRCGDVDNPVVVTQTVTDVNGNTSSCTAIVTVLDTIPPDCLTQNIEVVLDANGMASIDSNAVDDDSKDNCNVMSIVVAPNTFDCDDVGMVEVTQTVTDVNGNTSSCTAIVTVIDNLPPECLNMNIVIQLGPDGTATIDSNAIDDGSNDECGIALIAVDPNMFDCSNEGDNVVVQTVTDNNGNTSSCSAIVTVEVDPPECITMDITVQLDTQGMVTIADDAVNAGSGAECGIDEITLDQTMFTCTDVGNPVVVTQTVTDLNGNSSTCTALVTVEDTLAPVCMTQDIEVVLDENGMASIDSNAVDDNSSDNCDIESITVDPNTFDCNSVGEVIVTQTTTDINGNSSTCTAIVTVQDTTPPECLIMDITISLDVNGMASISDTAMDAGSNDACGLASIELSQTEFECADGDTVVVTQTVTDVNGNSSSCTANVIIENPLGPEAICQDTTIFLDINGMVSITPEDVDGGSTANCGEVTLMIDEDTFTCSDTGANDIILTVTDESGASDSCIVVVTVLDTIAPTCITQDVTVQLDDMGMASVTVDQIDNGSTDNCDVELSIDPMDFTCDDLGANTVTLTAVDPSGNTSTCDATVTVEDLIAPVCVSVDSIFITLPGNGMQSITVADVDDGSSDNCEIDTLTLDIMDFDCDDLGINVVTLTATDIAGNTSTCTTVVEIMDGMNFECNTNDIVVSLGPDGTVTITPEQIDNGSGGGCNSEAPTLELDITMFDCDDVGVNNVVLTVTTATDTALCPATVTVVDNLPPSIMCPDDVTVDCGTDLGDLSQFGMATAEDNCAVMGISETQIPDFNNCGLGTISRVFVATDVNGNTAACTQVITVGSDPISMDDIVFPMSPFNVNVCGPTDPSVTGMPEVPGADPNCTMLSITFVDSVEMICDPDPNTPCEIITRTWTVVDSCEENPTAFTFDQIINYNPPPPVFTPLNDITVQAGAPADTCIGVVMNFVAMATGCGPVTITNDYTDGGADASGMYPLGTTTVTFTAEDQCCNITTLSVDVTVENPGTPVFTCFKPIVCIPASGILNITADQLLLFEDSLGCSELDDYFVSFEETDPFANDTMFNCGQAGDVPLLPIFVFSPDTVLISDCLADLDINDGPPDCPEMNCPTANLTISGTVYNERGVRISGVPVTCSDPDMDPVVTSSDGVYEMHGLYPGSNYSFGPNDNTRPLEGVSTLDMVEIQKHLLAVRELSSPYQRIAADVNGNGEISVMDIVELRRLLLGLDQNFASNTSWRFVDAQHEFPDPFNPFMTSIPEEKIVSELAGSMIGVDFIAVKTGDVNTSYSNAQRPKEDAVDTKSPLALVVEEKNFEPGELVRIPVTAANFEEIAGFQFALSYDASIVEFKELVIPSTSLMDENNFGLTDIEKGILLTSWSAGTGVSRDSEEVIFELQFRARRSGSVSDLLSIDNTLLNGEAYVDGIEIEQTAIDIFTKEQDQSVVEEQFAVLQNRPNPFSDKTEVPVYLPQEDRVRVIVHSVDGRVVYNQTIDLPAGFNTIELQESDLGSAGIYYYTIQTDKHRATRKLTVLD